MSADSIEEIHDSDGNVVATLEFGADGSCEAQVRVPDEDRPGVWLWTVHGVYADRDTALAWLGVTQ